MSKSVEGSYVNLTDSKDEIQKKIRGVPTADQSGGEMTPGIKVLFKLLELFKPADSERFKKEYETGKLQFVKLKDFLSNAIYKELKPIQEKRKEFEGNPKLVDSILEESMAKCRELAEQTLVEVRKKMGLI